MRFDSAHGFLRAASVAVFTSAAAAAGFPAPGDTDPPTSAPAAAEPVSAAQRAPATGLRFETIAPCIHLIWTPRHDAKVVVAEFATFVAMIEAPFDDRTVRELLAEVRARFPGKPLRYVFHSHHHDHSIHAVDSLLAAGAEIVTSAANLAEVSKLTGDETMLRSRVLLVDGRFEIADGSNRLRVWVLKQGTKENEWRVPTPEYMLFEFPAQEVLVSGCLYNKPLTYHEVVNQRKPSLLRFIESNGLKIRMLVPTNTSSGGGFEDVCTVQMLRDTLEQGIRPEEVSGRFGAMTPEAMRGQFDAIAAAFGARTPRSFDLLVCSSQLVKDKFPEHALVLLDIAIRLFPEDPWPRFESGVRLWSLGKPREAEARWKDALALAKDADEREDMRRGIEELRAEK